MSGISKNEAELYAEYPSHSLEWAGTWKRDMNRLGTAYGVLVDDKELVFLRTNQVLIPGEKQVVTDIKGNEYYGVVFPDIEGQDLALFFSLKPEDTITDQIMRLRRRM